MLKLKKGDLVELTKFAFVDDWQFYFPKEIQQYIKKYTNVQFRCRSYSTNYNFDSNLGKKYDILCPNTIGVVMGYENVFMLNYRFGDFVDRESKDKFVFRNICYENIEDNKSIIVFMNNKLIAFDKSNYLNIIERPANYIL